MCTVKKIRLPENQHKQRQILKHTHTPLTEDVERTNTTAAVKHSRYLSLFPAFLPLYLCRVCVCAYVRARPLCICVHFTESFNMTDENSMPPSITSSTGFVGECNTSGVSSSTEQFIICCKVCGSLNGLRRCSRCKSVYYCSQVHQQVDWRVHKIECKKFATNLTTSE